MCRLHCCFADFSQLFPHLNLVFRHSAQSAASQNPAQIFLISRFFAFSHVPRPADTPCAGPGCRFRVCSGTPGRLIFRGRTPAFFHPASRFSQKPDGCTPALRQRLHPSGTRFFTLLRCFLRTADGCSPRSCISLRNRAKRRKLKEISAFSCYDIVTKEKQTFFFHALQNFFHSLFFLLF